jgi:hypothetical protein
MRTKQFNVSEESIVEFSEMLEENNLTGTITGVNEDSEVLIDVEYDRDKREVILDLMELLEDSDDEE